MDEQGSLTRCPPASQRARLGVRPGTMGPVNPGSTRRVVIAVVGAMALILAALSLAIVRLGGAARPEAREEVVVQAAPPAAGAPAARSRAMGASRSDSVIRVDPRWVAQTARATGIPVPAMRAYGVATLLLASSEPGCHLGWTTLAGIGQVESGHGTSGGRTLDEDGRSSSPVLGPALDGSEGVAAMRSSRESSRWHGDATWEHAIGPMQFLASTWDRWGADGDGDGTADPLDIDDAAYAAGRYLCADHHDLATAAGWNAAVLSYNHSAAYVLAVNAAALAYAARA
jgi:membrane-bound lytic murein transglycosylase B